jgi:hypothetical protein
MPPEYHRIDLPAFSLQRFSTRVTEIAAKRQLYYFTYCELNYEPREDYKELSPEVLRISQ